jgi:hypothetical protein
VRHAVCQSDAVPWRFQSRDRRCQRDPSHVWQGARAGALLLAWLLPLAAWAQTAIVVVRADGTVVPVIVYEANAGRCAPLALISPGAGGTEKGLAYLAIALQTARLDHARPRTQGQRTGRVACGYACMRAACRRTARRRDRSAYDSCFSTSPPP